MPEMEDFFDLDEVRAKVYLLNDGDEKNTMMATDEKLLVIRKGERHIYQLYSINSLSTGSKKLLLPLILGAIMAPFAFSSSFTQVFHPIVHLVLTLLGLLLFFVGWAGKSTFSINLTNGNEEFYFLPSISKNLQAFIVHLNGQLNRKGHANLNHLIFVKNDANSEEWLYDKSQKIGEFPIFGYTYQQILSLPLSITNLIAFDPALTGIEIKFEFDDALKMMRPVIPGPIDKKSIIKVEV